MKPDGSLEILDDIYSDIDDEWAELVLGLSGVSYKHLPGQHLQKRHGYRYGRTPTLEQARGLVKAGLWEDYIARARAYSGKGPRPLPTKAEFDAAQEHIRNARSEYAKSLDVLDKEKTAVDKTLERRAKLNSLAAKRAAADEHYRDTLREYYKIEENGINSFEKKLADLEKKKTAAQGKGDINAVDLIDDYIATVNENFRIFKASLEPSGRYWSAEGGYKTVALHAVTKKLERAHLAYTKAVSAHEKEEKKVGRDGIDRGGLDTAMKNAVSAADRYVRETASARRVAMAYLRNEAMRLRERYLAENRKRRPDSLAKMERELQELRKKEAEEKQDYAQRGAFYNEFMSKYAQAAYSLNGRIERIKNGDAADNRLKSDFSLELEILQGGASVKADVDTPVLDRTASAYHTIEQMRDIREAGVRNVGNFVGRNVLIERKPVSVKNGDYDVYNGRPYAAGDTIMVFSRDGQGTMMHEMGHVIEYRDPGILAESIRFKNRRTKGEQKALLKAVTKSPAYRGDERTQEDKFIDPYIGKDYGNSASEVLSMGLEMFLKNGGFRLMNLDPDMFAHIYAVVRLGM